MKKSEKSINKINEICEDILHLSEDDFANVENMIQEQETYCHPFKMEKTYRLNKIANHNSVVIKKLRELHECVKS